MANTNNTLLGLAMLTYNWEKHKKDIIDSYIPLICSTIISNKNTKINRDIIQKELVDQFGILIPLGAIESILKRMTKNDLLTRILGEFQVVYDKVVLMINSSQKEELDITFNELLIDLSAYSKKNFNIEFSNIEIEEGLISFFKEVDLSILFASPATTSVLPKVRESKKAKYIIAKYIMDLQFGNPTKFSVILKLAKGYGIASLITYENIQHYSGSLSDVEIYLDAPIIFSLIGLNGDSNLKLSNEILSALKENGAKIKMFEINHGEVIKTIDDAIKRLTTKNYKLSISSRVLRTAIRENISAQQLQIKLHQLDSILKSHHIEVVPSIELSKEEYQFQIDLEILSKYIEEFYSNGGEHEIPWYTENQIERDVESISNIFKIRKKTNAISLKTSKAILMTSNEVIAFAAKRYERSNWKYSSTIPVCVTDIFISTILWANYPTKNDNLNIKQLISECYSIMELDNKLLIKYFDDIKRIHNENVITDEQFYLLSATNLSIALLEQKTFNDINEYTDKTPAEILEDIQLKMAADVALEKEKMKQIEDNLSKISRFIAKSIFVLIGIALILLYLFVKNKFITLDKGWLKVIIWSISSLFGIFGILRWMELIPTKIKIESALEGYVHKKLRNIIIGKS